MATESSNVKYEEEFITNSKGVKLFTCRWIPTDCEPKALVFLNHGYAMECSFSMKGAAMRLVKAATLYFLNTHTHTHTNTTCFMATESSNVKYEEEFITNSKGVKRFTCRWIPTDCEPKALVFLNHGYAMECSFSMKEREENKNKLRILLGESMGGAMVLRLHRLKPEFWDGGVLVAPMCKLAEGMKPSPLMFNVLVQLKRFIPTWKIVPGQDLLEIAFRDPKIRQEIRDNPLCYKGRVRLQTAMELFKVTVDLEKRLKEVTLPFFIAHGEDDKVTDPLTSKLLYDSAASTDKTFKLYPGMWHALTYGEFTENTDTVFADINSWINERIAKGNSRHEREQKNKHDEPKQNKNN
nr:caffeoylshikimate esterase-like [Tanacetum cinerariifolium]